MKVIKGFTLAEVMIVLAVIGVLAGILIPVANNARPDEKVMKFKKAHATLLNVIHELVTSDKYYANGDLGVKFNGDLVDGTHNGDYTYFCNSVADILSTKKVSCIEDGDLGLNTARVDIFFTGVNTPPDWVDNQCRIRYNIKSKITTSDGVEFYETSSRLPFGITIDNAKGPDAYGGDGTKRLFGEILNSDGFERWYKIYCLDIDGVPANATTSDCVNECPFGYGIRPDGKIFIGTRANEWLEKGFQKGKNDN